MKIPTFIINLKSRPERKEAVLKEFEGKPEFDITIVEAIEHKIGLIGLWQTMKYILKNLVSDTDELILICQDDHQFTEYYSYRALTEGISEAIEMDADTIQGGVSWFQSAFQSSHHLFWIEKFSGLQFAILFKKFFIPLLNLDLDGFDAGDYRISAFTDKKWVIYPYISTQRDYGYSDVTLKNNKPERQEKLFRQSNETMKTLLTVADYFKIRSEADFNEEIDFDTILLPTCVIRFSEDQGRREHIRKQYTGHSEFDISIIDVEKGETSGLRLWKTIRNIISRAVENDEDFIIIAEDNHCFTSNYTRDRLILMILRSHALDADLLLGGPIGNIGHILPVSNNLCWLNTFRGTQFMVIFKKLFSVILTEPFDATVNPDNMLSQISGNKLSVYPFISVQENFVHPDLFDSTAITTVTCTIAEETRKRFERVFRNFSDFAVSDLKH